MSFIDTRARELVIWRESPIRDIRFIRESGSRDTLDKMSYILGDVKGALEFIAIGPINHTKSTRILKNIYWIPLPNWYKLNTYDSSLGNPGMASSCGLIRDYQGNWKSYFRHLGFCSNMLAKLWPIRDGLSQASSLGITYLEVESDSIAAINLIKEHTYDS